MRLEPITPEDLPELHRLIERAYRGDTARPGWSHEADLLTGPRTSVEELAEALADPDRHLLCWREDGAIRANVLLAVKGGELSYVGMVTVDPDLQAQGIGKRLLAAVERHAHDQHGATRIEVQVFSTRRELIAFYERRG